MADYAVDLFRSVHGAESDVPAELTDASARIETDWQRHLEACGPLVEIVGINDPTPLLKELDASASFRPDYLLEHHGVTAAHIEAFYEFAKFRYETGEYAVSADYLNLYRLLIGPAADAGNRHAQERSLQALWGRFGAEILVELWDDAARDLQILISAVRQSHLSDLQLVQQRAWVLHWSLFVFSNHPTGKDALVELFMAESSRQGLDKISNLNVIVLTCPWLLRYLVAVLLVQKRKQSMSYNLKTLLRMLTPADVAALKDPIVDFIYCLLVSFDFEGSQQKLADCASVIASDYFLSQMMLPEEFLAAARRFVFEVYCRVHQKIDLRQLAAQLQMGLTEAEKWIVDLIRSAQIDARLDAKTSSLRMIQPDASIYQQISDNTRDLITRTRILVESVEGGGGERERGGYDREGGGGGRGGRGGGRGGRGGS
jgi:translation initiation factor 3 subunit E